MKKAYLFDIYRGTTHDGPGLRSTVFFKGCPLSCQWCHNPEGISPNQRIWWDSRTCIGCGLCHESCKTGANTLDETGIKINDNICKRCGACVKACPSNALTFIRQEWTMDKLIKEVMRDKIYYDNTNGGVTASGGECMLQHEFLAEFFQELQKLKVDTAVDTCGMVPYSYYEEVLPHTNHLLYDLKLWDNDLHRKYTKSGNELILENAKRISKAIADGKFDCDLWIRTPLIPEATANKENLKSLGKFIAEEMNGVIARWELCSFNNSCITKYDRLNLSWAYATTPLIDGKTTETLRESAILGGVSEDLVVVTGLISE